MVDSTEALPTKPIPAVVVAKAGRYYRVARYMMTLLLMGYGAWSIYDGFVSWPHWTESHPREKAKTDTDIMLNKVLGVVLPPMGLIILGWAVYSSRGEYRLENGILRVPGHPPVPLEKIQSIKREVWDRKGIAYVDYDLGDSGGHGSDAKSGRGRFKIDDFVYEREPADQIFKAIEGSLLRGHETPKPAIQPSPTKVPPRTNV
jgi:hypothetical protein